MSTRVAFYTVREFCGRYRTSHTSFYNLRNSGRLKTVKIGRRTYVRVEDAEAWAAQLPSA